MFCFTVLNCNIQYSKYYAFAWKHIFVEITELCLCFLFSECRYDSKDNFSQNYKSSNKKLDNFMIRLQNTKADFMLGLIVLVKTMFCVWIVYKVWWGGPAKWPSHANSPATPPHYTHITHTHCYIHTPTHAKHTLANFAPNTPNTQTVLQTAL